MEIGTELHDFNYVMDIKKIADDGNDGDLIIAGAVSDSTLDLDGECVDQGSLRKAWTKYLRNPVIRLQHNAAIGAIGRLIEQYTDSNGTVHKSGITESGVPYAVVRISKASDVESTRTKIREGVLSGFSIGGRAKKITKGGKTVLMVKDLLEISVVDIPSNQNSLFSVIKTACVGTECELNKSNITKEYDNMEREDIVEIVTKTISEMKEADEYTALQKKYDALVASQNEVKVEVEPETVEKSLVDQVTELKAEIETMKTTPVEKAVQEGDGVVEKAAQGIIADIVGRHYGVA